MKALFPTLLFALSALSSAQVTIYNKPVVGGDVLAIPAKTGLIVDRDTGKILWEKNGAVRRQPASTTKIMTLLLLIERTLPTDIIVAPKNVKEIKESSLHLKPGEKLTSKNIGYGLMLRSANDACYAVAKHLAGSTEAFALMMNNKAKELGCENTQFRNPHGLPNPNHYTTARDLAKISLYAMKNPLFQEVVKTYKHKIQRSINQKDTQIVNRNKWLAKDPSADGVKTGFTKAAGSCYVGSVKRESFSVLNVILGSPKSWEIDHAAMLEWVYRTHEKVILAEPMKVLGSLKLQGANKPSVDFTVAEEVHSVVKKLTGQTTRAAVSVELEEETPIKLPIKAGDILGFAKILDADGFSQRVKVYSLEDIAAEPWYSKSTTWTIATLTGGLGLTAVLFRSRAYHPKANATKSKQLI